MMNIEKKLKKGGKIVHKPRWEFIFSDISLDIHNKNMDMEDYISYDFTATEMLQLIKTNKRLLKGLTNGEKLILQRYLDNDKLLENNGKVYKVRAFCETENGDEYSLLWNGEDSNVDLVAVEIIHVSYSRFYFIEDEYNNIVNW